MASSGRTVLGKVALILLKCLDGDRHSPTEIAAATGLPPVNRLIWDWSATSPPGGFSNAPPTAATVSGSRCGGSRPVGSSWTCARRRLPCWRTWYRSSTPRPASPSPPPGLCPHGCRRRLDQPNFAERGPAQRPAKRIARGAHRPRAVREGSAGRPRRHRHHHGGILPCTASERLHGGSCPVGRSAAAEAPDLLKTARPERSATRDLVTRPTHWCTPPRVRAWS